MRSACYSSIFAPGRCIFLAGRCVPMCWDRGAGSLDGLDIPSSAPRWALLVPGRPVPVVLQGHPGCQSVQFSLWFHKPCSLRCLFGDAQRRALAIHVYCERLLEACSWEHSGMPARVHLGMLLGAISGLKMRSSRKAFTGSVTRRFPSLPNFW